MKAIVLASGEGIRMRPLTLKTPKPLLKVNGKPIIDYVLESLPENITEVIIVIKYLGEQIEKHVGKTFKGKKITYVEGSDRGNAYSFLNTLPYLKNERFLLIYGDELPSFENVSRCLSKNLSVLMFNKNGVWIKDGVMVLNTDIFNYQPKDENFSTMVDQFIQDHPTMYFIEARNFVGELNTPEALKEVERKLCQNSQ